MLQLVVDRVGAAAEVARDWLELQARSSPSFFQSWTWIETWLDHTPGERAALRARRDGWLVALGVLALKPIRRRGIIPVNLLSLQETGDPDLDRLAVEYNGFLIDRYESPDLPASLLRALADWRATPTFGAEWDELVLPGVDESWLAAARAGSLAVEVDRSDPAFGMPLDAATDRESLLARISANSRGQLRRSLRRLAAAGPLAVDAAATLASANEGFDRLAALNARRWSGAGIDSAFGSESFRAFHRALIARAWPRREVDVLTVRAGETPIGYMYNFLWGGIAHSYATGFAPVDDARIKAGMNCHVLCAEHYARAGFRLYDLMAGEARFKRSLGIEHTTLHWLRVQRPRLKLRIETALRSAKRRVDQRRSGSRPSNSAR